MIMWILDDQPVLAMAYTCHCEIFYVNDGMPGEVKMK